MLSLPAGGIRARLAQRRLLAGKQLFGNSTQDKPLPPNFLRTTFLLSARPCLVHSFIVPFLDISQAFLFCPPQSGHHVRSYDGDPLTVEDTTTW